MRRVVLLDADMPKVSGFDVANALQDRPDLCAKITMLLTANQLATDIAQCRALGLAGHLSKPVSQSELLDAIMLTKGAPTHFTDTLLEHTSATSGQHPLDVLLAEDNVVNQKLAVRMLEGLGHRVTVVPHGAAAVEACANGDFDLILMDMQMPVMGGIEATRAIRKREGNTTQHQIIVAMTANAMQGDRERCLDAGMDGYVSKPIDKVSLIREIDRVIVRAQSRLIWLASNISLPAELKPVSHHEDDLADLDMAQAMERWDGDLALFTDVAQGFLDSCPHHIQQIQRAIYNVDSSKLIEEAHALAGAAGNLSALAIEHITRQLMAAAENKDFFLAATLADQLTARTSRLEAALKHKAQP